MLSTVKLRIYKILEPSDDEDLPGKAFDIFIMSLIVLNVIGVFLETVDTLSRSYKTVFTTFEIFSVSLFTAEYLLRLWTCTVDGRFRSPILGRVRFVLTPLALVDLIAILPFYLPMVLHIDLRFARALRLFRILRLFKLTRYSEALRTLRDVFKGKKEELIITLSGVFILLVIASSLMYLAENRAQPEAFSSIPAAMWWGVVTLSTVGYGDTYPITLIGKLLGQ